MEVEVGLHNNKMYNVQNCINGYQLSMDLTVSERENLLSYNTETFVLRFYKNKQKKKKNIPIPAQTT